MEKPKTNWNGLNAALMFAVATVLTIAVSCHSAVTWYPVPVPASPEQTKILLPASRDYNAPGGLPARLLFDYGTRDPYILRVPDGYYYMVATAATNVLPEPFPGNPNQDPWVSNDGIPLWRSRDLVRWETLGYVWTFERDATWSKEFRKSRYSGVDQTRAVWAPELSYFKGTYWITYSMSYGGTGILRSSTGKVEGPYRDIKTDGPLTDDIDTCLFEDEDGTVYCLEAGYRIARMKPDMSGLAEPLHNLDFRPNPPWGEGINMKKIDGLYVWSNAGNTTFPWNGKSERSYDCFSATSKSIEGPYTNRYRAIPYAGHNNLFQDEEGQWWSTLFHPSPGFAWYLKPGIVPIEIDAQGHITVKRSYPRPVWHYTVDKPKDDWFASNYDDQEWKKGPAGFGDQAIMEVGPLTDVATIWKSEDIWMRQEFTLLDEPATPFLFIRQSGQVEVSINGQQVYASDTVLQDYITVQLQDSKLMKGVNLIAVHCRKGGSLNYIDLGLIDK